MSAGPDGRQAGEFTLDEALVDSFRFNLSRQIVGEVRGKEIWAMIKAMESGTGSISTTHAADAVAAVRKLVTCAMEAGPHVTQGLATSKLAATVDLIVQLSMETKPVPGGAQRTRRVAEIIALAPGEKEVGYATTHVFRADASGVAVPDVLPDEYRALARSRVRPRGLPLDAAVRSPAMSPLIPSLAGGLIVSGILGIVVGLRPTALPAREKAPARSRRLYMPARTRMLLLAGLGLGLVGWVITGWVLALVIAPVAVIGLPDPAVRSSGRDTDRAARGHGGMDPVALGRAYRRDRPRAGAGRDAALDTGADQRRGHPARRPAPRALGHRDSTPILRRRTRRRHRRPDRREPHPRRTPSRRRPCQRAGRTRRVGRSRRTSASCRWRPIGPSRARQPGG